MAKIIQLPTAGPLLPEDYTVVFQGGRTKKVSVAALGGGGNGGSVSWFSIPGKPNIVASGATVEEARNSIAAASASSLDSKVDKVAGKGLSTEDYTTAEKNKLAGLANYSHPSNHPPSIIAQDANNRFVTDAEKAAWNGKVGANGSGASGTWGISISGNAATASNAVYATYSNAANAAWTSAGINSSASGTDYSAMVKNAGGTGDSGVAALAFHCNGYALKVYSRADGYFGLGGWSSAAWRWYSDPNGNMVASGDVTAYSDPRLKRDFTRIADPLGVLAKLDGGTFYWRDGFAHTSIKAGKRDYGILADQVEAVMPEIVSESIEIEGEKYKAVAYDKLVPVLIEAVKALDVRVKELEASRAAT